MDWNWVRVALDRFGLEWLTTCAKVARKPFLLQCGRKGLGCGPPRLTAVANRELALIAATPVLTTLGWVQCLPRCHGSSLQGVGKFRLPVF